MPWIRTIPIRLEAQKLVYYLLSCEQFKFVKFINEQISIDILLHINFVFILVSTIDLPKIAHEYINTLYI